MNNLIQMLLSIKNPANHFIERPELIQGYTEDEIKQIEQKYHFPIHGQFKEFLMIMGKCSGGLLLGDDVYLYRDAIDTYYFSNISNMEIQEDPDCQEFIKKMGNIHLVEKKYFVLAGINEHRFQYFMLLENKNDIIYEWDTDTDEVKEFGTLFDFLKYYRKITTSQITGENNHAFERLTTGRLL
ncbi:SMI1/KNR4 family protein [Conchiformibius steedae]|nr:SMI1/KNR4 family protein [Conchiformibius steedae]